MALKTNSPIFIGTMVGVFLSISAFILFISFSKYESADQLRPYDKNEQLTDFMEAMRTDYNNLLAHYADHVKIISSAFAFIAFLVTYQNKSNLNITPKAWGFLSTGIIVLVLSLIISQFGKELLYTMSIRNSVDIGLTGLYISRMINYICLIIATVCIGFYALELTNVVSKPDSHLKQINHEMD